MGQKGLTMKTIGIEAFATWSVGELSRLGDMVRAMAVAGYRDCSPFWQALVSAGVVVDGGIGPVTDISVVHPDALQFAAAVSELASIAPPARPYDVRGCLADMPEVFTAAPGERLVSDVRYSPLLAEALPLPVASLILGYAAARTVPDWYPEGVAKEYVRGADGRGQPALFVEVERYVRSVDAESGKAVVTLRTFEEDGRDRVRRRAKPGAFRKVTFSPDPALVVRARHAYAAWWCGMEWLAVRLSAPGVLQKHRVEGPQGVEFPWKNAMRKSA